MSPDVEKQKTPDNAVENTTDKEGDIEAVSKQTDSGLEALDADIVKNYLSNKLIGKDFTSATSEEKKGLEDINEAIFKRIKKTQRIPLDIKINSWIGGIMSMVNIFNPSAKVPTESEEKLTQMTSTVSKFDEVRDQFEDKITKAMSQFQSFSSGGTVMTELESAFTSLEGKVSTLKENKDVLKENAKKNNMNLKAYYQSQTRLFINEFIAQLKGGPVNNIDNTIKKDDKKTDVVPPVVAGSEMVNTQNSETPKEVTTFLDEVYKLEGTKYVRGGDSEDGIDCSGLIIEGWKKTGIVEDKFDTTAAGMYESYVQKIPETKDIKKGDLLFYKNKSNGNLYKKGEISHVMIALGPVEDGKIKIFDASQSKGVQERTIDATGGSKYELLAGRPKTAYDAIALSKKLEKEKNADAIIVAMKQNTQQNIAA